MSDTVVKEDFPTLKKDNQESYWGTGSDLTIVHDGTNTTVTSATGDLIVDNTLATGSTIMRLGTDTSATDFQIQNDSASALFTVNGAGAVTMSGTLSPAGLALADSQTLAFGTGSDVVAQFDGTDFTVDNTGATAKTIFRLGTDTSATSFVVENDSGADLLTIDGAGAAVLSSTLSVAGVTDTGGITTTQGVGSGTALTVGGRAVAADAWTAVTNTVTETATATYSIPANTLTQGKVVRVTWGARATATNSTDTLTGRLRLGGTSGAVLQATTAVDVANDNVAFGSFSFTLAGAPGAAVAVQGCGIHSTWAAAGAAVVVDYPLSLTVASDGALDLVLTLEWSVADAGNSAIAEMFDVVIA